MSMKLNLFDGKIKAVVNMGKIRLPYIESKTVLISDKSKIFKKNVAIYSLENDLVKRMMAGNDVTDELINTDLDIEMELAGKFILEYPITHVLLDSNQGFVYDYQDIEVITRPDGKVIERPLVRYESNLNIDDNPIRMTKNYIKRGDFIRKYIIRNSYQIYHKDNLSFNFLFEIAQKLDEMDSLVNVTSTKRIEEGGKEKLVPMRLVVKTGGLERLGFLEGRVRNAADINKREYALVLHLVELEITNIKSSIDVGEEEAGEIES